MTCPAPIDSTAFGTNTAKSALTIPSAAVVVTIRDIWGAHLDNLAPPISSGVTHQNATKFNKIAVMFSASLLILPSK